MPVPARSALSPWLSLLFQSQHTPHHARNPLPILGLHRKLLLAARGDRVKLRPAAVAATTTCTQCPRSTAAHRGSLARSAEQFQTHVVGPTHAAFSESSGPTFLAALRIFLLRSSRSSFAHSKGRYHFSFAMSIGDGPDMRLICRSAGRRFVFGDASLIILRLDCTEGRRGPSEEHLCPAHATIREPQCSTV